MRVGPMATSLLRRRAGRVAANQAARSVIAHLARSGLEVLGAQVVERGVLHEQGQPEALAERPDELLVRIGGRAAQMVVHVQHVEALPCDARDAPAVRDIERRRACQHQKRGRVRPT